MKCFDFIIVGAGIAGLISSYFLKDYNVLLVDKNGIFSGASGAAGAFLFFKVGLNTSYTKFINQSIKKAIKFYQEIGVKVYKKGVLILPRDEKDIEKFKLYKSELDLDFEVREDGFFFQEGSFIEPEDLKKKIKINFQQLKIEKIVKEKNCWVLNGALKAKNLILATGYEKLIDIDYIKIRPIWGERIEIVGEFDKLDHFIHKNVSVVNINNKLRIGATHKRGLNHSINLDEAYYLIDKAREVVDIQNFKIEDIKGSFRAGSIDYFPIVGRVIDAKKTIKYQPDILKGRLPKKLYYIDNLFIINGMGGRGFSNSIVSAEYLKNHIFKNKIVDYLDSKRLFIKWARKLDGSIS